MDQAPGQIIILNGAPRSGKSSIVSRQGLNVVVDVGHHDAYATPRGILPDCARRLSGLPVMFVGVRCPIEVIMERRRATGWGASTSADAPIPLPRALVATGDSHPTHLRPGSRHLGAEPRRSAPS